MNSRLNCHLLLHAYANGYFPMPDPDTGEPLWYRPDPRAILPLNNFHTSRSLQRTLNRGKFHTTINADFNGVIKGCASRPETWINDEFIAAYTELHEKGGAHSIEVWQGDRLVGGVYGVSMGGAFFAESKFHTETDASKVALHFLVKHMLLRGMSLLEVQFVTPHLARLGVITVPEKEYERLLKKALAQKTSFTDKNPSSNQPTGRQRT